MLCRLLVTWTLFVLTTFTSAELVRNIDGMFDMAPNYETGAKVAQWTKEMNVNPEELGNYYEGDIMLTNNTIRSGLRDQRRRWPGRTIPFVISGNFAAGQLKLIDDAMKDYHTYTCIRFKKRTNEKDYINIVNNKTGCWSYIGRIGNGQLVNLQSPGCVTAKGTVIHELMHACGFRHEQSREDRDSYVTILWDNIKNGQQHNFVKDAPGQTSTYNVAYNYASVMHYSAYAFSKNKQKTIEAKDPNVKKMGQRDGFTNADVLEINRMYGCKDNGKP